MKGIGDTSEHYRGDIEPIDVIAEMGDLPAFCRSNIIKYVMRYRDKDGKKDLLKARDYLDQLIDVEYPENHTRDATGKVDEQHSKEMREAANEKYSKLVEAEKKYINLMRAWCDYAGYEFNQESFFYPKVGNKVR